MIVLQVIVAFGCQALQRPATAGFWFDVGTGSLPNQLTARLGGPLLPEEIASIERLSRAELDRAFSGLRIVFTPGPEAFWRVQVVPDLLYRGSLAGTGESLPLGPLGGVGSVGFNLVASKAIEYAPADSSRQMMVEGIGRGIGRVAAHEFFHQILGANAAHNDWDPDSYEYGSPDRASQYYGELHWSTGWEPLVRRLGQ